MTKTLFITGTDTGVGKTCVTAILALYLKAKGIDIGVMKPIASGCEEEGGELLNEDAQTLHSVSGVEDEMSLINPVRYREPLAPLVAARRAGEETETVFDQVRIALNELCNRHEIVLVEGVGGLLVPIAEVKNSQTGNLEMLTCIELAHLVAGPAVVVARRNLGTINHTLLTVDRLRAEGVTVAGLIFCDALPVDGDDVAIQTSPEVISEMTGLPILGLISFLENQSLENLESATTRLAPDLLDIVENISRKS